jgi:hypothetical protein
MWPVMAAIEPMTIKVPRAAIGSSSSATGQLALTAASAPAWASRLHSAGVEMAMLILRDAAAWVPQGDSIAPVLP